MPRRISFLLLSIAVALVAVLTAMACSPSMDQYAEQVCTPIEYQEAVTVQDHLERARIYRARWDIRPPVRLRLYHDVHVAFEDANIRVLESLRPDASIDDPVTLDAFEAKAEETDYTALYRDIARAERNLSDPAWDALALHGCRVSFPQTEPRFPPTPTPTPTPTITPTPTPTAYEEEVQRYSRRVCPRGIHVIGTTTWGEELAMLSVLRKRYALAEVPLGLEGYNSAWIRQIDYLIGHAERYPPDQQYQLGASVGPEFDRLRWEDMVQEEIDMGVERRALMRRYGCVFSVTSSQNDPHVRLHWSLRTGDP